MRVLLLTQNKIGGMNHYVSQLANALSVTDSVTVICPIGTDKKNFNKNVKIIECHIGNTLKNIMINSILFWRTLFFLNKIIQQKPDIIHFNETSFWIGLWLPFLKKFPLVVTIHDVHPHISTKKIRFFFEQFSIARYEKYSDAIIVHGKKLKDEIYYHQKCHIFPIGDFSFFLNFQYKKRHEEKNTVLFFGTIEDYKGIDYLIQAIELVAETIPDIKCIIAGQGNFLVSQKKIHKTKNFEIINQFIDDANVPELFQRAQIVILPYIEGSQTGIIPIAYAFKKPVIVTDVGSIPELVEAGKTGLIVPPRDPSALSQAISGLLEDDSIRLDMGDNAYLKMKRELSWEKIAETTRILYSSVIEDKK